MGEQRAQNVIYIVPHDLGRHLGCYGLPIESPNVDRFAGQGIRFDQAFCSSPCCSPSRGCAMTGQYAHTNGLMGLAHRGWSYAPGTKTVVDYLNEAGVETAHFGHQHENRDARKNHYAVEGLQEDEDIYVERAVDGAITYLESRESMDKPFYLNVGTMEVHASRWERTGKSEEHGRRDVYGRVPDDEVYLPPYVQDEPSLREEMARFQACIRYFDRHMGRLFEAIDALGYGENTMVVFTTDHGIANMRAKTTLYDRGTEIALAVHMPGGLGQGRVVDALIPNVDFAPTVLDALGIPVPETMQGRSFYNLLLGEEYTPHTEIYCEKNYHADPLYDPIRAVRTETHHYIVNYDPEAKRMWLPGEVELRDTYDDWFTHLYPPISQPRDREELYDVATDPEEFVNLAGHPDYQEIKEELAAKLEDWMVRTDDPLLAEDLDFDR